MNLKDLAWLLKFITDESKHFLLAASMGLLVYSLTWITLRGMCWAFAKLTSKPRSWDAGWLIHLSCLLLGLSAALVSHWLLDYFSVWYTTPLGPPLKLVR